MQCSKYSIWGKGLTCLWRLTALIKGQNFICNLFVISAKGCENGWHAFRQTCLRLQSQAGKFSDAQLRCRASSIVELNFIEEVGEVISLLSSKFM